jgi:hypothetical protein
LNTRVFDKTLEYVQQFNLYKGKTAVADVREYVACSIASITQHAPHSSPNRAHTLTHSHTSYYLCALSINYRSILQKKGLDQYEIVAFANLCPEKVEEAKALIPSLSRKFENDDEIQDIIVHLQSIRQLLAYS